jgi:hypothetical protein
MTGVEPAALTPPGSKLQGRYSRIGLAATVVRAVEHVGATIGRHPRIVRVLNAFHRNGSLVWNRIHRSSQVIG